MKRNLSIALGRIFILFLLSFGVKAQEWKNVNPKMNHVLADTTFLRATEVILQPGEKSDMHTHPAHFFYALTDGKLTVHYKDGKNESFDLKPGASGVSAPERPHVTENTGATTVRFLLVELKEHPYQESKNKKK
ncbi:MAG TPA: cupin domain-containing protein [Flavobacterium sp.]|uniref:cupin domain-containing protein n=1 Tax=Flavobacterium sp. TaxID=239 RepID=UPI002DB97422|nr:cupin domain-containing protein [Flavobacterium sp.]HEU4789191.1 cupin domain-containing protein [Flavobacterium sp.]